MGIHKPVEAKNACDSSDQQVLYTCLSGKKDRGESSPGRLTPTFLHSRTMQPCVSAHVPSHHESPRENPRVSWTVYWTSNTSCLARLVRGATYATIRPYTCNYFGQSVPVKSHASSYIYRPGLKVERHGIRCRFTTVRRLRFLGCCNLTRRLSFPSLWEEGGWDKFLI